MAGAAFRRLKAAIFRPNEPFGSVLDLREEYAVSKSVTHGFPHRPSAIAYSPWLRVMAIGCQSGEISLYGKAGVEATGFHNPESSIVQIIFLGRQMQMLTVGFENDLHLWKIENQNNRCRITETAFYQVVYPGIKRVSMACYPADSGYIAVGTEGGHVLLINLDKLTFSNTPNDIIYWNKATEPSQGVNKLHPGSIEALDASPTDPDKLLIGFEKGILSLWSISQHAVLRNFPPIQYLCSAVWHPDGSMFVSSHEDGSIAMWSTSSDAEHGSSIKPYGLKEECRKVQHIAWRGNEKHGLLVFEGGLGRREHGDKFCVSVKRGDNLTTLEFTSRVIGLVLVDDDGEQLQDDNASPDDPAALIVLCEEELVAIDLRSPELPSIPKPYLYSLHESPLTCIHHVANCPEDFLQALYTLNQSPAEKSPRPWPIFGGIICGGDGEKRADRDLLVTGHEDGSVRFWDSSGVALSLVYKLTTSSYFINMEVPPQPEDEDEDGEVVKWPVFVKTGTFDPFCDDPRLAVTQIEVCPLSRTMAIAGYGGQVFVFDLSPEPMLSQFMKMTIEMKLDGEDISRKLNEMLEFQASSIEMPAGFQATVGVLTCPPSPTLALSLSSEFGLVGFGCRRGLSIVDYFQARELATECTIMGEESRRTLSRLQSIRKSFRLTMRTIKNQTVRVMGNRRRRDDYDTPMARAGGAGAAAAPAKRRDQQETEEQIQQRREQLGNAVRCLMVVNTYGPGVSVLSPTVFACTNSGRTFLYSLELPAECNRHKEHVHVRPIEREFSLRHGAPVLAFSVVDHSGRHIASSFEIKMKRARSADNRTPHYAVFCTEEQIKVVTLPNLKSHAKFKLYDSDGSQLQRIGFMQNDDGVNFVAIVSNEGELMVFSLPDLQLRLKEVAVRWDDFRGQRTFVLTRGFEAFHMRSPSQLQRLALRPKHKLVPYCNMDIREVKEVQRSKTPTSAAEASLSDASKEKRSLSNPLSALGSFFHRRSPTPEARSRSPTPTGRKSPVPPAVTKPAPLSKTETDFFSEELERAENEQDFVNEVLSGMDALKTPEEEKKAPAPVHEEKPMPKARAKPATAHERMLQAAQQRGDKLSSTDLKMKKMSDSAAGLAAISGMLAAKSNDDGGNDVSAGSRGNPASRDNSVALDPKGHEDMEMILDMPKHREVDIDDAASRRGGSRRAGKSTTALDGHKINKHPRAGKSVSTSAVNSASTQEGKKWWQFK